MKRLVDAWWDSNNHYVVMQADMELGQIMEQDQDLFFSEAVVEVDMGNTTHQIKNKSQ